MSDLGLPLPPTFDYTSRDYTSILNDLETLISTYMPSWTDRAPGDFGIVLLELFAYLGDNLNYYIDRIGNEAFISTAQQYSSIYALAELLDYVPYGPIAAQTLLQFTIPDPSSSPVVIPAGTVVSTQTVNGQNPVYFQTTTDLTLWGDNATATTQTQTGTGTASQSVYLTGPGSGLSSLYVSSVTVNGTAWSLATGNTFTGVSSTATEYIIVNYNTIQFGNGVNGAEPPSGDTISVTYYPYNGTNYTGTVNATQGQIVASETMPASTGQPNITYQLYQSPVVNDSVSVQVNNGLVTQNWIQFNRLVDAGPDDLAFSATSDQNGVTTLQFGDGVNGQIPPLGAAMTASYTVGGGTVGNVAANTLTQLLSSVNGVSSVTNPSAAVGGAPAETADSIRTNAPQSITAINRAVTAQDYASLCLNVPAVGMASAEYEGPTSVYLFIHPAGGFITTVSQLENAVTNLGLTLTNAEASGYLDTKKMGYVTVTVYPPHYVNSVTGTTTTGYVPVDIACTIQVAPNYMQSTVAAQVSTGLYNLLSFANVNFGSRVTLASVYQVINTTPGVQYGIVTVCARHETPTAVGDVVTGYQEIPMANSITVTPSGGIVS